MELAQIHPETGGLHDPKNSSQPLSHSQKIQQSFKKVSKKIEFIMKYFVDPALFFSDVFTDILVLIAYSEGGHDYYYNALLTAMIIERFANIAFTLGFILTRSVERKKYCQNLLVLFLNFIYLDPLAEIIQFGGSEDFKRKAVIRKVLEGVLEGLPSTMLNIHQIFYNGIENADTIYFISLFVSVVSLSKNFLSVKMFIRHGDDYNQTLLGKYKQAEFNKKNALASLGSFFTIAIFSMCHMYCWGQFTDATRPDGTSINFFIILIFFFVYWFHHIIWGLVRGGWPIAKLAALGMFVIGFPLFIYCGALIDHSLYFEGDGALEQFTPFFVISPYARLIQAVFYLYYYIKEETYNEYPGFVIFPILYAIYFIIYIPIWTVHLVTMVKKHKLETGKLEIWEAWRLGIQNTKTSLLEDEQIAYTLAEKVKELIEKPVDEKQLAKLKIDEAKNDQKVEYTQEKIEQIGTEITQYFQKHAQSYLGDLQQMSRPQVEVFVNMSKDKILKYDTFKIFFGEVLFQCEKSKTEIHPGEIGVWLMQNTPNSMTGVSIEGSYKIIEKYDTITQIQQDIGTDVIEDVGSLTGKQKNKDSLNNLLKENQTLYYSYENPILGGNAIFMQYEYGAFNKLRSTDNFFGNTIKFETIKIQGLPTNIFMYY